MKGCGSAPFRVKKLVMIAAVWACLAFPPHAALGETPGTDTASPDLTALLTERNAALSRELRGIRREIAALRADLDKPGFQEVFGGIGYILGLFGAAAFAASRRRDR